MKLTIASYNIQHGALSGYDMDKLTESIRLCGADIVGIQEADVGARRSGERDIPALLGQALGYEYRFAKAIDLQGGAYGNTILSRYPIEDFEVVPLSSGTLEKRCLACCHIGIADQRVTFWNTHVSYENLEQRTIQLSEIGQRMAGEQDLILTADFNTDHFEELYAMGDVTLANRSDNYIGSFRATARGIDNVVLKGKWKIQETGMIDNDHSDHNLIYAVITDEA